MALGESCSNDGPGNSPSSLQRKPLSSAPSLWERREASVLGRKDLCVQSVISRSLQVPPCLPPGYTALHAGCVNGGLVLLTHAPLCTQGAHPSFPATVMWPILRFFSLWQRCSFELVPPILSASPWLDTSRWVFVSISVACALGDYADCSQSFVCRITHLSPHDHELLQAAPSRKWPSTAVSLHKSQLVLNS